MKTKEYKIATLGSHSALQIMKGARDEGFGTILICEKGKSRPYESFRVADRIIEIDSFRDVTSLEAELKAENVVIIPHGSLFNAVSLEQLENFGVH
jgi:5-formaminoimidazole-4-carboxamide-1-(beta)-D-ribofuranosyl 5'-monophosphate synthetase